MIDIATRMNPSLSAEEILEKLGLAN